MHHHTLSSLRGPVAAVAFFCAVALPAAAHATTIRIEQSSAIEAVGQWTLLKPTQETLKRTDKILDIHDSLPGKYTLFATPPEGTTAVIQLKEGPNLAKEEPHPQISFNLMEGTDVTLYIRYTLENSGIVGVNSTPSGMRFEITGPNGWKAKGVTPQTYQPMPVGNYSVQYLPDGCPTPSPKGDLLQKDSSAYFSLDLKCATFRPSAEEKDTHVSAKVEGDMVVFDDVPQDAWFAPFVATVSKRGILTGYKETGGQPTGKFGPENPVTVGELAKIAHGMGGLDEKELASPPRNPGAAGKWFMRFVASAEQRGWTLYNDGTVDLVRPATRGEVLVTLLQVLDEPLKWQKGVMFTDVSLRTPYAAAIETAALKGIVSGATDANGSPTGLFHPENAVTRAEMAKILIQVQEKFAKKDL